MTIKSLTKKIAELERAKQDKITSALAYGLLQGALNHLQDLTDQELPLSSNEIGFLTEVKARNLVTEDEIKKTADLYELNPERLEELRSHGAVDWLSKSEQSILDQIDKRVFLGQDSQSLQALTQRKWLDLFSQNEKDFLTEIQRHAISQDDHLKIGLLRAKFQISKERWEQWLHSDTVVMLTEPEKKWLAKLASGATPKKLEEAQEQLGLKQTFHLMERVQFKATGEHHVRYSPFVTNLFAHKTSRAKVNWRQTAQEVSDFQTIGELIPKDIANCLADRQGQSLSYWQKQRLKQFDDMKILRPEFFEQKLWQAIKPQERTWLLTPKSTELTEHAKIRRQELMLLFSKSMLTTQHESLLTNQEYFFLAALRRKPASDLMALAQKYHCNPESLKDRGYLDFLSKAEFEVLARAQNGTLEASEQETLLDLKKRRFYLPANAQEFAFLQAVAAQNIGSKEDLKPLLDRFLISEKQLAVLKNKGFIDYLDEYERQFCEAMMQNSDKEHLKAVAGTLNIDSPWRLKKRLILSGPEHSKTIDEAVKVDPEAKYRFTARINYKEPPSLLSHRLILETNYKPELTAQDSRLIFLENIENENIVYKDLERLTELKACHIQATDLPITSNAELAFMQKIANRSLDLATLQKIGQDDFKISLDQIDWLINKGFITAKNDKFTNNWQEPSTLLNARIWHNMPAPNSRWASQLLTELGITEPYAGLKLALNSKTKPIDIGHKLGDYALYFKILRREHLSAFEAQRLASMRANGVHPESPEFSRLIKEEPSSWRLKEARKQSYLHHYEKAYGVNKEALHFTNKFKQVSHEQLLQIGLSEEEIARYCQGIKGQHRLLENHILPTPKGPIRYYSISHKGPISGRAFLEQDLPKNQIAIRPQQRKDLLFHDLKVVDSVLAVIADRKNQGWQVKEIHNEASQYSLTKAGLKNENRQGGPSFMDAVVIFEEIQSQGSGGSKTETIAIEYGNYDLTRMAAKLANCQFDQAFVFARQDFIKRYERNFHIPNISYRAI